MMKTKDIFQVQHYFILVFFGLFISCNEDDDSSTFNQIPVFNDQSFSISEDINDNTLIGKLMADDPDGDELKFELFANSDNLFELDSTGELKLAKGKFLDYELKSTHDLVVTVSDKFVETNANVQITVTDVFERPFITSWQTLTNNESITIPTNSRLFYQYQVDWGDGTITNESGDASHTYSNIGIYEVEISGVFPTISFQSSTDENRLKIVSINQWGDNRWQSMEGAFFECTELQYAASDIPNLEQVINMNSMFAGASTFNGDIGNWDVSNVQIMTSLFIGCEIFNQDLSSWNVSNVLDMAYIFDGAESFDQALNSWDVSSVTNMEGMFVSATSFNQDIGNWNVSNVVDMDIMFASAESFNQDLTDWSVSQVTDCNDFFTNSELTAENLPNFINCTP